MINIDSCVSSEYMMLDHWSVTGPSKEASIFFSFCCSLCCWWDSLILTGLFTLLFLFFSWALYSFQFLWGEWEYYSSLLKKYHTIASNCSIQFSLLCRVRSHLQLFIRINFMFDNFYFLYCFFVVFGSSWVIEIQLSSHPAKTRVKLRLRTIPVYSLIFLQIWTSNKHSLIFSSMNARFIFFLNLSQTTVLNYSSLFIFFSDVNLW